MSSFQSKPRILCLHGHGSNAHVTKAQIRNLELDRYFEVTHLTAPLRCNAKYVDATVHSLCPNGPFYSWIRRDGDVISDLVESLRYVSKHIRSGGPYNAVYGFSHGAGIAALLSCPQIRSALGQQHEHESPWKFIFAACPTLPLSKQDILRHFDLADTGLDMPIPIAHMIGMEDPSKTKSEDFVHTFQGNDRTGLSVVAYFEGGHEISSETENLQNVAASAMEWFGKHNPHDLHFDLDPSRTAFLPTATEEMSRLALELPKTASIGGKMGQFHLNRTETIDRNDTTLSFFLQRNELKDNVVFRSPDKESITFGALETFVKNEGNLSAIGCKPGDKVAYMVPFGVVGAAAFIAIATQCQAVPLDPDSTDANLRDALQQMSPDVFILFDDLGKDICERAEIIAWEIGIRIVRASGNTNEEVPFVFHRRNDNNESLETTFFANDASDNCLLLRTSGTTSKPKVVPITMSSLVSNAIAIANNIGLQENDVGLNAMPLFHIGGIMTNLLSAFVSGSSSIFLPKFDALDFITTLIDGKSIQPTWFSAVPTMLAALEALISPEEAQQSSLRFIRVGAAAISNDLMERLQDKFGCRVISTYSMTECMPISQPPNGMNLLEEKPGSVGKGLNVSVCIVDSNLVPLTRNSTPSQPIGEICISGPTVMKGYITDTDEANRSAFFLLGGKKWFRTGDLGYLDADGFLYITGRRKEMIKVNGEQVSPIEIEDACTKFSKIKTCVAFSQPSNDAWGEQIGIACVLSEDSVKDASQLEVELKRFLKKEGLLANWKIPKRIEFVQDGDLPKTRSGKYVRVGLSGVLDNQVLLEKPKVQAADPRLPIQKAAFGVQYVLAIAVMYVHIGNLDQWMIPSSLETFTRSVGASDWSNTRTWCLHTPLFFFVGGFLLATGCQSPITDKASLLNFYKIRILSLHPMYLVSILLCVAIFIPRCNPGNYITEFDPNRKPVEGDNFVCQATPVEMSWGWTLFTSIFNYSFLLQSWFFTVPFSWFLSAYTWFSSSYIFCIFVFPWCHKPFFAARENSKQLWKLTALWGLALYLYIAILTAILAAVDDETIFNRLVLSFYMFPPGWVPCFSIGIGVCFLVKNYLKEQYHNSRRVFRTWGLLTDALSVIFLLGWIGYGVSDSWARPSFATNTELGGRYWAAYISRLICPVGFVWFVGLCLGKGATGWLLSGTTIVEWLAPASYNIFLFHGPLSELYFRATRGLWWSYPKSFYWFSPYPIPVANWEIPIVMAIVTVFSVAMHFYVNAKLIGASHWLLSCLQRKATKQEEANQLDMGRHRSMDVEELVTNVIARVSNVDPRHLQGVTDLTEIGISSMALPVVISEIHNAVNPKRNRTFGRFSFKNFRGATTVQDLIDTTHHNVKLNLGMPTASTSVDIEEGIVAVA